MDQQLSTCRGIPNQYYKNMGKRHHNDIRENIFSDLPIGFASLPSEEPEEHSKLRHSLQQIIKTARLSLRLAVAIWAIV